MPKWPRDADTQRESKHCVMVYLPDDEMMMRFAVERNCGCRAFNGELQATSKKGVRHEYSYWVFGILSAYMGQHRIRRTRTLFWP